MLYLSPYVWLALFLFLQQSLKLFFDALFLFFSEAFLPLVNNVGIHNSIELVSSPQYVQQCDATKSCVLFFVALFLYLSKAFPATCP